MQVVVAFAGLAIVKSAGRVSVKSSALAAKALAVLSTVNVSVLVPPAVPRTGPHW